MISSSKEICIRSRSSPLLTPWPDRLTWGINDGQVGAVLVLDLDHNLLGPELLLPLQALVLVFNVLLQGVSTCSYCPDV